jgi:16S rRNA (adenine1518-N6/adenine1519-N6)-dimethyltransferase
VKLAVKHRRGYNGELLSRTKRMLNRLDLKARKSLGQHFLVDREVLAKVIEAAGLTPEDVVIEVGPGLGVLTTELAAKACQVVAVELDDRLAAVLRQRLASAENVTIVNGDILKLEPSALVGDDTKEYKAVANLPYYITSAVIRHFLEARLKPRLMVLMVQKEVAEAIVAEPGRMSLFSASVQFYGRPEIVGYVPASCFYPQPEVDSAILKVDVYPQPAVAVDDNDGFFQLVRAGFTASRKQIVNSLALGLGLPKAEVMLLLETAGIMCQRRAETLALEEWQRLWQVLRERQKW